MSAAIKPGDLVMVVLPATCCGNGSSIGAVGRASAPPSWATFADCDHCGNRVYDLEKFTDVGGDAYETCTLKKIDPPADGDCLPTRRDLEVPA